jgi:hypothetical protein
MVYLPFLAMLVVTSSPKPKDAIAPLAATIDLAQQVPSLRRSIGGQEHNMPMCVTSF